MVARGFSHIEGGWRTTSFHSLKGGGVRKDLPLSGTSLYIIGPQALTFVLEVNTQGLCQKILYRG